MTWQANTLFTDPPSIEITTATTDRWSVGFTNLEVGESLVSAVVTLAQIDPPTYATVPGFAGVATVAANAAVFDITGAVLVRGQTYLMRTTGTLNTGKVVVFLTAVLCVA
jgi:hypothetical protein